MNLTAGINEVEEKQTEHVDHFIKYGTDIVEEGRAENEDYARWVLSHFRLPAITKIAFDKFMVKHELFCAYKGKKYRVTGASRLGDVWLHSDLNQSTGYTKRVNIGDCTEWSNE